jgi:dihydrofolate synthase/folylpolyglutamate synthase
VISAAQDPDAADAIVARIREVGASLIAEGLQIAVVNRQVAVGGQVLTLQTPTATYQDVMLPLHGEHQAHNALLALTAVETFLGGRALDGDLVAEAFADVDSPGRLEVVRTSPTILLDGAHNPAGGRALAAALEEAFDFRRLVGVVGVLADKDAYGLLVPLASRFDHLVITQNDSARALPVEDLAAIAADLFDDDAYSVEPNLAAAIDRAVTEVDAGLSGTDSPERELGGGGIVIFGSLVTVGAARTLLKRGS